MSTSELTGKCRELKQLQRLIEEAEAEAEAIKDQLKAHLTAQGIEEVVAGEYRISWKAVISNRLDAKALKAALPEVVQRYTVQSTTRRFVVN